MSIVLHTLFLKCCKNNTSSWISRILSYTCSYCGWRYTMVTDLVFPEAQRIPHLTFSIFFQFCAFVLSNSLLLNIPVSYLYNYEFWLSLCKIVRSSVILLLPLFKTQQKLQGYQIPKPSFYQGTTTD